MSSKEPSKTVELADTAMPDTALPDVASPASNDLERALVRSALFGDDSGVRLGRFRVVTELGAGGMGVVYEGWDDDLDRRVALKVLHSRALGEVEERRLLREAKALARLSHPNVVQVYESGKSDDQVFIAMEYVEGQTLSQWQDQTRTWQEVVDIYLQAGRGLQAAHGVGLVHRDFKPGNAIVDDGGRLRVLDFGLAVEPGGGSDVDRGSKRAPPKLEGLTSTGAVVGTPAYMSPEQLRGEVLDPRSDQFSYCAALYEGLYGERPFQGRSLEALAMSIASGDVAELSPNARDREVPGALRTVVLRGLAKEPDERYPELDSLLADLERLRRPDRRAAWALGGVAVVGALGLGVALGGEDDGCDEAGDPIVKAWAEARPAALEHLAGLDRPYAETTANEAAARLDAHVSAWATAFVDGCRAAAESGPDDRLLAASRERCQRRLGRRTTVLIEALSDVGPDTLHEVLPAVAGLPVSQRCDDATASEAPQPPSSAIQDEVAELQQQVDQGRAWLALGRVDDAADVSGRITEAAQRLDYAPLRAEATSLRAVVLAKRGDGSALQELTAAVRDVEVARDESLALETLVTASQWALDQNRPDLAVGWITLARAKADRQGSDAETDAQLLQVEASHALVVDDYETALTLTGRGIARVPENPTSTTRADLLTVRSHALEGLGRFPEALEIQTDALGQLESILGDVHPDVAKTRVNVALALLDAGQGEPALAMLRRAEQAQQIIFGEQSWVVAQTRMVTAKALSEVGQVEQALSVALAAQATVTRIDPKSPRLDEVDTTVAAIHQRLGQTERALQAYRAVERRIRQRSNPDEVQAAMLHSNVAECLVALGRYEQAAKAFEAALDELGGIVGPEHPMLAYPLTGLGLARIGLGESTEALEPLRRAESLTAEGSDPALLAELTTGLALALPPDDPEVVALRTRSNELRQSLGLQKAAVDAILEPLEKKSKNR